MHRRSPPVARSSQSGAVLYVALVLLILMALLGIVALQIAGLQERMSANYVATNSAFQNAEGNARLREGELKTQVLAGGSPATNVSPTNCTAAPDFQGWLQDSQQHVRRLDLCFAWGALDVPSNEAERTDQIYQVTSYARDRALLPTSEATVDTVFIP